MERGFLFIIAIALAFGVGIMGSKRKIGFGWAFVISLLNSYAPKREIRLFCFKQFVLLYL